MGVKPDCGVFYQECLACGHWNGSGRMDPGLYCFYSAVFKGKTARPVPIAEARKACEKLDWPETFGHQTQIDATGR